MPEMFLFVKQILAYNYKGMGAK